MLNLFSFQIVLSINEEGIYFNILATMAIKLSNMILLFILALLFSGCGSADSEVPKTVAQPISTAGQKAVEPIVEEDKGKKIVDNAEKELATATTDKDITNHPKPEKVDTKPTAITTKPPKETLKEVMEATTTTIPEIQKPTPAEPLTETEKPISPSEEIAKPEPEVEKPVIAKPNHAAWNAILQKHVGASGKVNYKGIKSEQAKLEAYCADLAKNPIENSWSRAEKMAYWINAYNAFTIKLIVDNYPISSIMDLNGGKPWERKWIKLGDKTYSLNQIENDILRPVYKDARIHFAVNCAAKSCPPLLNKAWTAANLESNFAEQTKAFINDPTYNQITSSSVKVSKIFDWYGQDFGDLKTYLNKYLAVPISAGAAIGFQEYDWKLNQ